MCSRVAGSSAPNGSSIRMMRGHRISVRAMATRCRIPPDSWLRILERIAFDVETDFADPLARTLPPLGGGHAPTLEAERHVVFDGSIVERRVILKTMPRSAPGLPTACSMTRTLPSLGG